LRLTPEEERITERQREILQLTAEGNSMKEIAYLLGLQPGTIGFHKYRMMNALGIHTNAGLIQYAVDQHMISKDVPLFWRKTDGANLAT
jgi:DNA-binding NarL/FixJ family response regulator